MDFIPSHRVIGGGHDHLVLVLHGILGAGRNLVGFATRLSHAHPDGRFALIDLRNHGRSQGAPGPDNLITAAEDLAAVVEHLGQPPSAIIAHSFGGKVAIQYAKAHPDLPLDLYILDSAPGARAFDLEAPGDNEVLQVFAALRALPGPFKSRSVAIDALFEAGIRRPIGAWLATSLTQNTDGFFEWCFELPRLEAMLEDYYATDHWPFFEAPGSNRRLHLVRGETSDRWTAEDIDRLEALNRAGAIVLHSIPEAGHWVHVDQAQRVHDALSGHLLRPQ